MKTIWGKRARVVVTFVFLMPISVLPVLLILGINWHDYDVAAIAILAMMLLGVITAYSLVWLVKLVTWTIADWTDVDLRAAKIVLRCASVVAISALIVFVLSVFRYEILPVQHPGPGEYLRHDRWTNEVTLVRTEQGTWGSSEGFWH